VKNEKASQSSYSSWILVPKSSFQQEYSLTKGQIITLVPQLITLPALSSPLPIYSQPLQIDFPFVIGQFFDAIEVDNDILVVFGDGHDMVVYSCTEQRELWRERVSPQKLLRWRSGATFISPDKIAILAREDIAKIYDWKKAKETRSAHIKGAFTITSDPSTKELLQTAVCIIP